MSGADTGLQKNKSKVVKGHAFFLGKFIDLFKKKVPRKTVL